MEDHKSLSSKNLVLDGWEDEIVIEYEDVIAVDLFPYKIKNRELFYHRNHPEKIHPKSLTYTDYWGGFLKKCIEGYWIQDEDGTWVFMMPKLFYYINYAIIYDKERNRIHPHLRDLEWILFTYFLCFDGFSGFSEDDKYSCYEKLPQAIAGELTERELDRLPKSIYKEDGTFKEYVDPWTYLRITYLIKDKRDRPLGIPLYENGRTNCMILGSRATSKTFSVFVGYILHEFTFSGVRTMEDIGKINNQLLFAIGSGSKDQLQRSLNNVKSFYDNQPGQYDFNDPKMQNTLGAFYKNYQGGFTVGGKGFQHIMKAKGHTIETFGSTIQMSVIEPDRKNLGAGDRFRVICIEEVGFVSYLKEVHAANKDSLASGGEKVGSALYLGTSGDMEAVADAKEFFDNPDAFEVFGIPNLWKKNSKKKCGLFLSTIYKDRTIEDDNGFIDIDEALRKSVDKRNVDKEVMDSVSFSKDTMFNPIVPEDMLIASGISFLPKREAQQRLNNIEAYDLFKAWANVGTIEYNINAKYGVSFEKDLRNQYTPITKYSTKTGDGIGDCWTIYEPPPEYIPDNTYWILFDTVSKQGEGPSFYSILVYKHFAAPGDTEMKDTIVAEWLGRKDTMDQNFIEAIKGAMFFNAKIFAEINVGGFVDWCKTNKHYDKLQADSYRLEKEINPKGKRNYYKRGCWMDARKKFWGIKRLNDWLMEVKEEDENGIPIKRNIDNIFSPRILDEIVNFDYASGNYDHISSLILLMILIGELEYDMPKIPIEEDIPDYTPIHQKAIPKRRRCAFENF